MKAQKLSLLYTTATGIIMRYAEKEGNILFPGLIYDEWLTECATLKELLSHKTNGISMGNSIPAKTMSLLSHAVGFDIIDEHLYEQNIVGGSLTYFEKNVGTELGVILKKPEGYVGGLVTEATLDQTLVKQCREAKATIKSFIDKKITFRPGYPYVELSFKKNNKEKGQSSRKQES
jgi:hypothetical protein